MSGNRVAGLVSVLVVLVYVVGIRLVRPGPPAPVLVGPTVSCRLEPSDETRVLQIPGKVRLTVPGGLLTAPAQAVVTPLTSAPALPFSCYEVLSAHEISLGDLHELSRPVTVEFAVDPSRLGDEDALGRLAVVRRDRVTGEYFEPPFTVDREAGRVRVVTNRLSDWYMLELWRTWILLPSAYTGPAGRFGIRYDPDQVRARTKTRVDPATPDEPRVPAWIRETCRTIHAVFDVYEGAGLAPPSLPLMFVVDADTVLPTYRWDSKKVYVGFDEMRQNHLRYILGHEIFHAVQGRWYTVDDAPIIRSSGGVLTLEPRHDHTWWLEASAEYAAWRLNPCDEASLAQGMGTGPRTRKLDPTFLRRPLGFFGQPHAGAPGQRHQYEASHVVERLVAVRSHGASIPTTAAFADLVTVVGTGRSETALAVLDAAFAGRLDEIYGRFALDFLFGTASPLVPGFGPRVARPSVDDATPLGVDAAGPLVHTVTVPAGCTAHVWEVLPEVAGGQPGRSLTVDLPDAPYPQWVSVYACALGGDERRPQGADVFGTFTNLLSPDASFSRLFRPGERLYVVTVNSGTLDREVTVRVAGESLTIRRPIFDVEKGVVGAEYAFSALRSGVPDRATLQWTFADGGTGTGERVTHAYRAAGSFEVRLVAVWDDRRLEATTTMVIAPDQTVTKEELTFYVYRRFKNRFGTSKQACQNFHVQILDPQGNVVDGGDAVGTNGSFSIVMPTGTWGWRVTGAWADPAGPVGGSGTVAVTAGGRNFVEVEGTPAERFE